METPKSNNALTGNFFIPVLPNEFFLLCENNHLYQVKLVDEPLLIKLDEDGISEVSIPCIAGNVKTSVVLANDGLQYDFKSIYNNLKITWAYETIDQFKNDTGGLDDYEVRDIRTDIVLNTDKYFCYHQKNNGELVLMTLAVECGHIATKTFSVDQLTYHNGIAKPVVEIPDNCFANYKDAQKYLVNSVKIVYND
jgi:hypothetical protein